MSGSQMTHRAPVISLDRNVFREFCETKLVNDGKPISLVDTRNVSILSHISEAAKEAFTACFGEIKRYVDDPSIGIAGVDIPTVYDEDPTKDAICGALTSIAIGQVFKPSILDKENKTPFSMFNASAENNKTLNEVGMKNISPTDILEFHSDGSIFNGNLSVPDYIALYNIFINYEDRGNFHWVPNSEVDGHSQYAEEFGYESEYVFALTPSVYANGRSEKKSISAQKAKTAIFSKRADGHITTFMNGEFVGKHGVADPAQQKLMSEFRKSINDSKRFSIPQESRRMIILNNSNGFHARDIFEKPFEGHSVTRSYLRSASKSGTPVGVIVN